MSNLFKKHLFAVGCFLTAEFLSLLLNPYSKTLLSEGIVHRSDISAGVVSTVIYGIFLFAVYLIVFFDDNYLWYCKEKIGCLAVAFIGSVILNEGIKVLFYNFLGERGNGVYFALNGLFLLGTQLIFKAVFQTDFLKKVNKTTIIFASLAVLTIVVKAFFISQKPGLYDDIYSLLFMVLAEILWFIGFNSENSKTEIKAGKKIILWILVALSGLLIFKAKMIAPVGSVVKFERFGETSETADGTVTEKAEINIYRQTVNGLEKIN